MSISTSVGYSYSGGVIREGSYSLRFYIQLNFYYLKLSNKILLLNSLVLILRVLLMINSYRFKLC